jgi:hypothetical protein
MSLSVTDNANFLLPGHCTQNGSGQMISERRKHAAGPFRRLGVGPARVRHPSRPESPPVANTGWSSGLGPRGGVPCHCGFCFPGMQTAPNIQRVSEAVGGRRSGDFATVGDTRPICF